MGIPLQPAPKPPGNQHRQITLAALDIMTRQLNQAVLSITNFMLTYLKVIVQLALGCTHQNKWGNRQRSPFHIANRERRY